MACRLTSLPGDGAVVFRQTRGERSYRFNLGEPPVPAYGQRRGGGGEVLGFSSDSRLGAYVAFPTHD